MTPEQETLLIESQQRCETMLQVTQERLAEHQLMLTTLTTPPLPQPTPGPEVIPTPDPVPEQVAVDELDALPAVETKRVRYAIL